MRASGILCHISSLPSPYGIGTFGQSAYRFVDFLVATNQTYWQILPIGPTSFGDSPYQTFSAFACNPYFIDLDFLIKDGLLDQMEIDIDVSSNRFVDYKVQYEMRYTILKKAFNRFDQRELSYQEFIKDEHKWLDDYALFMALKDHYQGQSWDLWPKSVKHRDKTVLEAFQKELNETIGFNKFMQYQAFKQYQLLKTYANQQGIQIFGDMPIYVSYDSCDVWVCSQYFLLDDQKNPTEVAGVPPDDYAKAGQLWGNPLYDWEKLKSTQYQWWIDRFEKAKALFDLIRIDHFIGFQNYYSIPFGHLTAEHGQWKKGPGIDLFNTIKHKLGDIFIVAEDLGVVTKEVRKLLKQTGFPGMKLLQFAFDSTAESDYLPHNHEKNTVCYTGTHDNQTSASWFKSLNSDDLTYCLNYINHHHGNPVDSLIKATLQSVAETAVIPIQDYLGLEDEARMNIPSTTGQNWKWRLLESEITEALMIKIAYFTSLYGRNLKKTIV